MIDNFEIIESNLLKFEPGYFYKFECLVRNTDGPNDLWLEGSSKTNRNILIKSWYVDTQEYYERIKHEATKLCDLTGGRLYVTLDRKSIKRMLKQVVSEVNNMILGLFDGQIPSLRRLNKLCSSCASKSESSDKLSRTIMFDVDIKDEQLVITILNAIKSYKHFVLPTKKGYHIVCELFDTTLVEFLSNNENVQWERNQIGLVYMRGDRVE